MPDPSDIDGCLTDAYARLGALVDALGRADVAGIEAATLDVARTAGQLRVLAPHAAAVHPLQEQAIDDVRWMVERARRLGRTFGGARLEPVVLAYQPDGRVGNGASRVSTLEVKG